MKALAVALLVLVVVASARTEEAKLLRQWVDFQSAYNKAYSSQDEADRRYEVFKQNVARAEALNAEGSGATFGVTKFMDLSPEEFKEQMGLKPVQKLQFPQAPASTLKVVPDSWDWREQKKVQSIKDQGQCGSCWAFSTAGVVESAWAIAGHDLPYLAEQELVDCDKADQGCNGGDMEVAYQYVMKNGLVSGKDYKYTGSDGSCKASKYTMVAKISNWTAIADDADEIAKQCYENGPISIGINANRMQYYSGGIDNPSKSSCNPKDLDHGVIIVGFGVSSGKKFWIIRNSWGDWGEKGYYRIVRGSDACGCESYTSRPIVA